ncbi:hypothetical protein DEJ46_38585 [Streptomyces venezuelae]|uniref:Insertion element IS402-like domain-containing protein n=1 Tax=Streptomyces venezuelae TaxID=54571 RepID=A0A5P2B1F0_STRVZ|nr:hypothetical protein DEJ46_38585 [Streptomyces venezuelae]
MRSSPWIVSDDLGEWIELLLPKKERRFRYPGHKPLPDRQVLCGILFVLHTGIQWEHSPQDPGFGSADVLEAVAGLSQGRSPAASSRRGAGRMHGAIRPAGARTRSREQSDSGA